ncbi:MAG TPA: chloride channel protein [Candidatus Sulfotelmatobacter sp.]|nr:chloride channel protein [Candidatus Sulfotelmatobacter sp.]
MRLSATLPSIAYRQAARGYELRVGPLRIPQSTYLLVAALLVGLGGGEGAVLFRALIALETNAAGQLTQFLAHGLGRWALVVTLAVGGAAAAWVAARFAPEARGHGVPEVMAAVALRGGIIRPRIILIKALCSATTIGFGGAAGREGPIVQIGSTIGSVLGQWVRAPAPVVRTLVACGAAAGISATFNAPIGGVFFASEVILGEFAPRSFAVVVVASVVAAVVGRAQLGDRPSFDAAGFALVSPRELWLYALLGVLCAVWAALFVRGLYACEDFADRIHAPAALKGACGFALVGLLGVAVPQILGVGYEAMQHVLDGHVGLGRAFALALAKPIATSLTLAAGGSGGVFAPSLFTGAMLGDAFGRIVHTVFPAWTASPAAYGLVAMAALFAAAAEAPITAITIVFEMSYDYTIILPLMIATVIATILGRRLLGATVYEMKLLRRGIDWQRVRRPRALAHVRAGSIANSDGAVAAPDETLAALLARMPPGIGAAVVVEDGRLLGVLDARTLAEAAARDPNRHVTSLLPAPSVSIGDDEPLERAADLLVDPAIPLVPVLGADGTFAGVISRADVLAAYRSAAAT